MNIGGRTGSSSSNNPGSVTFERGETSILAEEFEQRLKKIYTLRYKRRQRLRTINNEFILKDPTIQYPIPPWRNTLNIDCVTDKKKALDVWRTTIVTALLTTPKFVEENRDINAIYKININSFQGLIQNWYKNISQNIKKYNRS